MSVCTAIKTTCKVMNDVDRPIENLSLNLSTTPIKIPIRLCKLVFQGLSVPVSNF